MKYLILLPLLLSTACSSSQAPKFPAACAGDPGAVLGQVGAILLKEPDPKNLSDEAKDMLAELGAKYGHDVVLCMVKALVHADQR